MRAPWDEIGMSELQNCVKQLAAGKLPAAAEIRGAFRELMSGKANEALAGAFLVLLRLDLVTPEIVSACAEEMRAHSKPCAPPFPVIDVVGTGGDGIDTFNVSTAAALVVAAAGGRVLKHGNRSNASKCGSADLLEALGANLNVSGADAVRIVESCGFCFLFAQNFHPAMRHVAPVRKQLGVRTVFNLLGPLTNPARADFYLSGVFGARFGRLFAETFAFAKVKRAMVVHSEEGLDEISIAGRTRAWIVADGVIEERELTPEDFGLPRHPLQAVAGGAPPENVATLRAVLAGEEGAVADFVVLNSAAALWVSGLAADLRSAALLARRMLQSGKARQTLEAYVALSRAAAPPAAAGTAAVAVGSPDSVLATIAAHRRDVVTAAAKAALPLDALLLRALASPPPPPLPVLARLRSGGKVALMAEIKRASPSKGVICADADAAQLARVYAAAGAAVISVLTEPKWFRGSVADLRAASRALETVPHRPALLLKDFVMEEYQLVEARASGADLALLIVALLEQPVLERLLRFCWSVGLEALVEVATEDEARRAVAAGARLVGINNRNLHNFSVDMDTTARLIRLLPLERVVVAALSGIQTHEDVARFAATGASAVLVGETLMRSADAAATAAALRGRFAAPLVKVCGVRDADTARAAVAAGADLIGLVFAHSPRQVSAAEAKAIVAAVRSELRLPPSRESPLPALLAAARAAAPSAHIADSKGDDDATKAAAFASLAQCVGVAARQRRPLFVGVFADQSREEVARVAEEVDLDLIQLHGGEGWGAFPAGLPRPVIRAVALGAHDASPAARAWAEADPSHVAAILLDSSSGGGSGRVADWAAAAELSARVPLILAGGLDGDNVAAAIARVRPWGVDASSRLETDGRKDAAKVARFCAAAAALSRL